jgi:sarcosine oxidase, subunit beta
MTSRTSFDTVIIGGGISGIMSAYFLASAGQRVLLVERGVIAGEASGRNGGLIAPSTYDSAQYHLGHLTLKLWPELVANIGLPTEYRQDGALSVVPESEADDLVETARILSESGDATVALGPDDARAIIPHLNPSIGGALLLKNRGNVNPVIAAKSFALAARRVGVTIWEDTRVTGIEIERDRVATVETSRGRVSTPVAVNCAGAWASVIGEMAGVCVPVIPHRLQIAITEEVPPISSTTFSGYGIYARQARSGQVHFGLLSGPAWDPPADRFDRTVTPWTLVQTARQMAEFAPGMADVPVLRSWAGINSITPDTSPIVDHRTGVEGFIVAAGFWNGFGMGPATGKVVSELILEGRASVDISGLSLGRFDAYPSEVMYPYRRWRGGDRALTESPGWPPAGLAANG